MKSSLLVTILLSTATAFSPAFAPRASRLGSLRMSTEGAGGEGDGMYSVYDDIGFKQEEMAIGLSPLKVMEHLGTKDDLVAKFLKDNKKFDEARAEEEVMKFMMDREMVEKYIAWEIKKLEPDFQRNAREENFSDPGVVGLYAAWLVGGAGLAYFKNVIAAPKYASGEWEAIHIHLPNWMPGQS